MLNSGDRQLVASSLQLSQHGACSGCNLGEQPHASIATLARANGGTSTMELTVHSEQNAQRPGAKANAQRCPVRGR